MGLERETYLSTMVVKGNFLAPISSQLRSFLSAVNHSSTFMPVMFFRPVEVRNRLANALSAKRVFVSLILSDV